MAAACSGGADLATSGDLGAGSPDYLAGSGRLEPGSRGSTDTRGSVQNGALGERSAREDNAPVAIAYVDVEHTTTRQVETSQAIAHVARAAANLPATATLVGLSTVLPRPGHCAMPSSAPQPALNSLAELALLDAGTITIHAQPSATSRPSTGQFSTGQPSTPLQAVASAEATARPDSDLNQEPSGGDLADRSIATQRKSVVVSLAPRAFPSVSSLASGVVYTSRDRAAELPDSATYRVDISGGSQVPAMTLFGQAPSHLQNVTLSGQPIDQVTSLAAGQPIDVTWDVGAAGDLVFIEVVHQQDAEIALRCTFSDEAGSGTIPWVEQLAASPGQSGSETRFNVHRYRQVVTSLNDPTHIRGELRFDFELSQDVFFE